MTICRLFVLNGTTKTLDHRLLLTCPPISSVKPVNHVLVYAPENQRFSVTLESFADRVSKWQGLYFEMDGSFVWAVREAGALVGQIDGMIYDREESIEYLDLKGAAPLSAWERLLKVLTPADSSVQLEHLRIFHVPTGVYWSWAQFVEQEKRD